MKLIHTSDWHLGQAFYNYSRDDDHRSFCSQLCSAVRQYEPDALVISGDIFDVPLPSIAAQRLMVDMFTEIHEAYSGMRIVVISGNHDSASRLGINARLWEAFNVSFITAPEVKEGVLDCDRQIVELPGKGFIVGAPYLSEYNYSRFVPSGAEDAVAAYHQALLDRVAQRNSDSLPVVLAAHLAVSGADPKGQNAARFSFNEIKSLGEGYDYAALGHIHFPMTLSGRRVRYSGSPIPLSFDEGYDHSVSYVSIERHGEMPVITEIPIVQHTGILTVPVDPLKPEEAIAAVASLPDGSGEYIRVNMLVDGYLPGNSRHLVEQALKGKNYRFCTINAVRKPVEATGETMTMTTAEIRKIEPLDIAARYYALKIGGELPEEWREGIITAMEQATQNESL